MIKQAVPAVHGITAGSLGVDVTFRELPQLKKTKTKKQNKKKQKKNKINNLGEKKEKSRQLNQQKKRPAWRLSVRVRKLTIF